MSLRKTFASRPWIAVSAAAAAVCMAANIVLVLHRGGIEKEVVRQRDREREMTRIAEDYRRLKATLARRSEAVAPAGALNVERIEELAAAHRVATDLNVTIPPATTDDGRTERFVDLSLARARRQDLAGFLLAVENLDPAIRTRSLRIVESRESSGSKDKTFVDARIRFSAYEKAPLQSE